MGAAQSGSRSRTLTVGRFHAASGTRRVYGAGVAISPPKEYPMAKAQKRSSKEIRKPKAAKPPKPNASNPSTKPPPVGIVTIRS